MTRILAASGITLLLIGCAQVREISGGPKDSTPPTLVGSEPPNESTGFTGDRILLHFDERVKLDRVREQLLVSPPLAEAPDVHVSGAMDVAIDLKAPLDAASTYSFNLGDAVVDLTEGNKVADLTYVVSTGDHLDSSSVSGLVLDAATGKPTGEVHVLLYADTDSTGLRTGRPAYATRTDGEGRFRLHHLRNATYRLHALRDQNANLRFDLPNEEMAFQDGAITLPDTTPQVLRLFREPAAHQLVMDQRVGPDREWLLVLARPAADPSLRDLDRTGGTLAWSMEVNDGRDTVRCWPNDTTALEGRSFEVSDGGTVLDTLTYRVREKMPFYVTAQWSGDGDALALRASRPLARTDASRMSLRADSTELAFTATIDSTDRRLVRIGLTTAPPTGLTLRLLPKSLEDVYSGSNDTLVLSNARPRPDQLGTLRVRFTTDSAVQNGPFLLQLLAAQGQTVRTVALHDLTGTVVLAGVPPASYGLRLVEDRNGNGRTDTGLLASSLQPERVRAFPGTVVVRAGWEVDQTWELKDP